MQDDFCKVLFGRSLFEVDKNTLEDFFDSPQCENSICEFKSGDVHIGKLLKVVSGFLNTNGGLLIIGAPREKQGTKECQGELTNATLCKNQDHLSRQITGNILPIPLGIECHPIEHDKGISYLVHVPKSPQAPHQDTKSGIYYIRIGEETKAAPHGLLESLFFKRQKPNFKLDYEAVFLDSKVIYDFSIKNDSHFPANGVSQLFSFTSIKSAPDQTFEQNGDFEYQKQVNNHYPLIREIQWKMEVELEHFSYEPIHVSHLVWNKDGCTLTKDIIINPSNSQAFECQEKDIDDKLVRIRLQNLKDLSQSVISVQPFNYNVIWRLLEDSTQKYLVSKERVDQSTFFYRYEVTSSNYLVINFKEYGGKTIITHTACFDGVAEETALNP